jgi:lipopolysaccharide export system protein LptA
MKFSLLIPLLALWLLPAAVVRAEQADRFKPLQVEADRMQHDEPRQLTLLTGKVQAIKGTLLMRASRMEVQQQPQGQQLVRLWADPGERVFFRQKREGLDEFIEGEAAQAVYDSQIDQMTLSGQAEVRMQRNGVGGDRLEGQRIVYNNTTEVLSVDGQTLSAGSGAGRSRVRAVLVPKTEASAPRPPQAVLRSSPPVQVKP